MEEDVLTKEEVTRRLKEGTPFERLKGIANVLGDNIIGGYIEDYESPGEKLGAGIEAYARALFQRPVETLSGTVTNLADTINAVATPSYDEKGMPVVTRDQALQALNLASGAGATGAVASGARLANLGKVDPTVLRMAGGRGPRDNLPVDQLAAYDNAVRDAKDAVLQVQGFRRQMGDPTFDPMVVAEKSIRAKEEAARLLSNSRGGVSLTNRNTEAIITPSTVYPGKYRISYIDRRSREPMGDTEGFDTMEAAIKDAMDQGYVTLERFDPQNFANGGEVLFPREASEQMADIEYEVDMQPYLHDPLSKLGFDPKKIRVGDPQSEDHYSPLNDIVTLDPNYGMLSKETQAHEFRHRGLQKLLDDYFMLDPGQFKRLYGQDAFNLMVKVHQQQRRRGPVENRVQERVAEMFQRPEEFYLGNVYETSDARVFQTFADAEAYAKDNPGVEFRVSEIRPNLDATLETPRAIEFRDYMINKNRGETMQQGTDVEFEAVRRLQEAASDVLSGVGSLNETARGMFR
jgi:hypothetical protein